MEVIRGRKSEKKNNWDATIIGIVSLGIGYYLALSTESVMNALGYFFVAVILVIISTYALFTAGSIAFLKMLRKNKNYYYKKQIFYFCLGNDVPYEAKTRWTLKYLYFKHNGIDYVIDHIGDVYRFGGYITQDFRNSVLSWAMWSKEKIRNRLFTRLTVA